MTNILNLLAFFVEKKAECVTWYNQTKTVTQTQQHYCKEHQKAFFLAILY